MKKVGELYTAKGRALIGRIKKIQLFDGRFDTAYRLVKMEIAAVEPMTGTEIIGRVMTEHESPSSEWDWSSNTEIAWASVNTPISTRWGYNSYVDPDNLIVEDVYLNFSGSAVEDVNYMLTFQKYEISDWRGALTMVRNQSQG